MKAKGSRSRVTDSDDSAPETTAKVPRVGMSPPSSKAVPKVVKRRKNKKMGDGLLSGNDSYVSGDGDECLGGLGEPAGGLSGPTFKVPLVSSEGRGPISALKAVTSELVDVIFREGMSGEVIKEVLGFAGRYEAIVMELMLETERLKGNLEVFEKKGLAPVQKGLVGAPPVSAPERFDPVPKPVETWSVVVRSQDAAQTPKQVVSKVVEEVAPTLDVRVHEVKPIKAGGAVIRTPSVSERNKIVSNNKFKEVGLEVAVNEKRRPRVSVLAVPTEISTSEFMEELFDKNIKDVMDYEAFKKNVRIVSAPWSVSPNGMVTVVLEGNDVAINALLRHDRCYIKWFAFRMREFIEFYGCYRCLGFDHGIRECRLQNEVCRRCGQEGHKGRQCVNELSCRNCVFKGKPSGHLMMSEACPLYCARVARRNARH